VPTGDGVHLATLPDPHAGHVEECLLVDIPTIASRAGCCETIGRSNLATSGRAREA
jgi:hypothetical protein